MIKIKKVGVIGSGVMGAGIAAQAANAGAEVVLLDIASKEGDKNAYSLKAKSRMEKHGAAGALMSAGLLDNIEIGNLDDDLNLLSGCDWIVEVVIENLDIKRELYSKIDSVRKAGSAVSSNTSTIPLAKLIDGMSDDMQASFFVTHFFNPPRHMRLLEFVTCDQTDVKVVDRVKAFCDKGMGKTIVDCKDRPGFIANRLGVFWMQCAVQEAVNLGISIEEADGVLSKPCGFPKTGVFGLFDLVGIDLMPHVAASLGKELESTDAFQAYVEPTAQVKKLIEDGFTGRKSGAGFYRIQKTENGRIKEVFDLKEMIYRPLNAIDLKSATFKPKALRDLLTCDDIGGQYAWQVLSKTLSYALELVGDACDYITGIDEAMRLGYNWKFGPFELIDLVGADWFAEQLKAKGLRVPTFLSKVNKKPLYRFENGEARQLNLEGQYSTIQRADGVLFLSDVKRISKPILSDTDGNLWDLGEGVLCLESTSKMNTFTTELLSFYEKAIEYTQDNAKALVIYNEGPLFAAGANLAEFLEQIEDENWDSLEQYVETGQKIFMALKYAPFPVVGAPAGGAYGGGVELLLHCDAVQAFSETYMGLVETNIGIIPGWGGCKEMMIRQNERNLPGLAYEVIRSASVSGSAYHAIDLGYLRPTDGVTMNRSRLLLDAKQKALSLVPDYSPRSLKALSSTCIILVEEETQSKHDQLISRFLGETVKNDEEAEWETITLNRERSFLMNLIRTDETVDRIKHMLATGKPLKN